MSDLLRLIAFDDEDLKVISANLQDALVRVGDMAYLPGSKQFQGTWLRLMKMPLERFGATSQSMLSKFVIINSLV